MPPCKKKWPAEKTTLTFTPEGRRPQTFFPPVITLAIPAPLSSSPVNCHCRAAALQVEGQRKKVKGLHIRQDFPLFPFVLFLVLPLLYDLSVHRSDKNVVLFIYQSNQKLTSVSPRLFDDFFRSVMLPVPCRDRTIAVSPIIFVFRDGEL